MATNPLSNIGDGYKPLTLAPVANFLSNPPAIPGVAQPTPSIAPNSSPYVPNSTQMNYSPYTPMGPVQGPKPLGPVQGPANMKIDTDGFVKNSDGTTNYRETQADIERSLAEKKAAADALAAQNATPIKSGPGFATGLNLSKLSREQADRLFGTDFTGVTQNPDGTFSADKDAMARFNKPVVGSSSSVVNGENKITQDITSLNADNEATKIAHNDYLANLKAESDALEVRRQNEMAGINASFDAKKRQTEQAQKSETGTFTSTLARIGGFLGDSASAQGALINLNQTHEYQLQELEGKRQSAISEARNAINDKQFAIARLKATEAKDYAKQIADNKQQFFENKIKILNNQRQQDEANRTAIKDKLEGLMNMDPAQIPDEVKREVDEFYGIPGFTDKTIAVKTAAAQVKSEADRLKVQKDLLDIIKDIPAGQKVKFPDGTEYTGIGSTSDISVFQETDANGVVRQFTYNKGSREMTVTSLGAVGKPSADGIDKSNPKIVLASGAMEQLVDPKSGYIPVDAYIEMYRAYVKENNGKGKEFIENFDPLIWTGRAKDFLVQGTSDSETEE